jgi:type I restriction enzyme S subunit
LGRRVPDGWRVQLFGEVVERQPDAVAVNAVETYREIGIRSHGKGIFHKDPVSGSDLGTKRVFWVRPGRLVFNIVFAWEGAVALTSAAETGMIASHRFPTFAARDENAADVEFLRRFFQAPLGIRLLGEASPGGAGRNRTLNQKFLEKIPIAMPPVGEQRKIAAILLSVDVAMKATRAVIDQVQRIKRKMMGELLTRGIPGRHTRFRSTAIGDVPETWQVVPIQSVVQTCDYGLSKSLDLDAAGIPVLRMGNLRDGHVALDELKFVSSGEVAPDLYLERGDVLFNRTNSAALVGKVGLFGGANRPVAFASYLLRLRPRKDAVDGSWLASVMNTDRNQARIRALATPGVSQVNVNRGRMLELVIPVAPLAEQLEIVAIIEGLQARVDAENAALRQLSRLQTGLTSVLLTGALRVAPYQDLT